MKRRRDAARLEAGDRLEAIEKEVDALRRLYADLHRWTIGLMDGKPSSRPPPPFAGPPASAAPGVAHPPCILVGMVEQRKAKTSRKPSREKQARRLQYVTALLDRSKEFMELMKKESDRGCILVAAAILENTLGDLLGITLRQDKTCQELLDPERALGTLSSRIELTYALGLISKDMRDDLNLIRKIRNDAAHFKARGLETGFDTNLTQDWVRALSHVKKHFLPVPEVLNYFKSMGETGWKALFMTSSFGMLWYLDTACLLRREHREAGTEALTTPMTFELIVQTEGLAEDLRRRPPK